MVDMEKLVDRYLRHLSLERGLAKNTLSSYSRDLADYLAFLRKNGVTTIDEITDLQIEAFVAEISRNRAASSAARTLAGVRGWHKYLLLEGLVNSDKANKVSPPKQPKRLPKAISVDSVVALLDAAGPEPFDIADTIDPIRVRDRAILELLYATGARVSEVVNLDIDDLIDPTMIRLFGKGSKERVVPVGK